MPGRAVTIFLAATALVLDIALPASAHYPHSDGWDWTCVGGMPSTGFEGSCNGMSWADPPSHAANAEIHFYYETSIGAYGYTSQVTIGYSAWDETDGHEFNYIRESTDTSSNVNISVVNGTICGNPSSWGCTSAGADSNHHIKEGTATVRIKAGITYSLVDDVAAHEFGHLLGLGHSDESYATMYPVSTNAGMSSLSSADKRGRCQVYGHAHSYWGGCA